MNIQILDKPGELYLGSDIATARAQGARRFRSAANAVRFAMEHAAPVSLRGARLDIGDRSFGPAQIRRLHLRLMDAQATTAPRRRRRYPVTAPSLAGRASAANFDNTPRV